MKALLVTLGSHGDIHPFIAIGRALNSRGHDAVLAANPYYQPQIAAAGVGFAALSEMAALKDIIAEHDVMHPRRGPMAVMRKLVLPMVPGFVQRVGELIDEHRPDTLVFHPVVMGAPWAVERMPASERPRTVSVTPSPLIWSNLSDPMVLLPNRSDTPGPLAVRFDQVLGRTFMGLLVDPGLNRVRRSLGLPRRKQVFNNDATSADLNLGVWSPVFRPPLPGDPARSVITGFCTHDRDHTQEAPEGELRAFLDAGPPPLVFALGSTGVHAAGRFYEHAVACAQELGQRALLVVGRDQSAPPNLPHDGSMKAVAYAPYSAVFPRASVVVHHGGAGTTAQGLASGRPTPITPMAHDQFDNAARARRLGASLTLNFTRVTPERMTRVLRLLLNDDAFARAAAAVAPRLRAEDGAARAAEAIEACCQKGATPTPLTAPIGA